MSDDLKKWLPWIAIGLLALIVVVALIANLGDGDTVAIDTTTSTIVATTTVPETTTTTVPDSTTTVPETTTSTPPPESTTTAPPETTTTADPDLTVDLSDEGIQAGDEWVYFGFDDDEAVAAVAAVLGTPTHDSGWVDAFSDYGACPWPVVRGVHWDDFIMLFTEADTDFVSGGVQHFFSYYFTGESPDLLTTEAVGIGSSVEELETAYGGPLYTMDESFFDPSAGFWTYDFQTWTGLWGYSTGQTPAHVVTSINGGQGCGE